MIERIYFKNNLTFAECELEFKNGLVVFSGSSGAGKSVIFNSILSAFAMSECHANLLELSIDDEINLESIENSTPNIFKIKKDKSTRYFLNNQALSKQTIASIKGLNIRHLSAKNYDDFKPSNLLFQLDLIACKNDKNFQKDLENYKENYKEFLKLLDEVNELNKNEQKINELKEFLSYELNKIEEISPKPNEFEELLELKKRLSKKDKIKQALSKAEGIFAFESSVCELLKLAEIDAEFFNTSMRELNEICNDLALDNNEFNIEEILNRLEKLNYLVKKYGSIEDALAAKKSKKIELEKYENIEFSKSNLEKLIKKMEENLKQDAGKINAKRKEFLKILEACINEFLQDLFLEPLSLRLDETRLNSTCGAEFNLSLNKAGLNEISSGELNRLRLCFLAAFAKLLGGASGYIFLDEIDANLSGKEAASVANLISLLSVYYQIFAITHLPWLCAKANQHFLVSKENNQSSVKELSGKEKEEELARMISDENINTQALEFVRTLLKENQ